MQDAQLIFSEDQNITANATTVASTNVIDTGALTDFKGTALSNFGQGNGKMFLNVVVGVQPDAGTGLYLDLEDCATEGGTYKPTGIGVDVANAVPIATLVAGYVMLSVPLPANHMRFLRVLYTTTGNHSGSVGTVNAYLSPDPLNPNTAPYRA